MNAEPNPRTVKLQRPNRNQAWSKIRQWLRTARARSDGLLGKSLFGACITLTELLMQIKLPGWLTAPVEHVLGKLIDQIADSPKQRSWNFLSLTIRQAIFDVCSIEESNETTIDSTKIEEFFEQSIPSFLVRHDFFEQPRNLSAIDSLSNQLVCWLADSGIDNKRTAAKCASSFPTFFEAALLKSIAKDPKGFAALRDLLKCATPECGNQWRYLAAFYETKLLRPIGNAGVQQQELYVPLRGYWVDRTDRSSDEPTHHYFDLQREVDRWLKSSSSRDRLLFIAGGPGAGKSTFVQHWASGVAGNHKLPTILVPICSFETTNVPKEVRRWAERQALPARLAELDIADEEDRLLILDGLDELPTKNRSLAHCARDLVESAERLLRDQRESARLRIVITTRTLLYGDLDGVDEHRVLHLIGYRPIRMAERSFDPHDICGTDQRETAWSKWWAAVDLDDTGVPQAIYDFPQHIGELSDRPVFNHLLTDTFHEQPELHNVAARPNAIYFSLVEHVWQCRWDLYPLRRRPRPAWDGFIRSLQMLGIVAWQRGGGTRVSGERAKAVFGPPLLVGDWPHIAGEFDAPANGGRAAAPELLLSFFFQRAIDGDGFELTHPSFTDYLAACALARFIAAAAARAERAADASRDLLRDWSRLTRPTRITDDIVTFLEGEISALDDDALCRQRALLIDLFNENLEHGNALLQAIDQDTRTFRQLQRLDAAAELALLAAIGCCTKVLIDRAGSSPKDADTARIRWQPAWPTVKKDGEDVVHAQAAWDMLRRLQHGQDAQQGARPARFLCGMVLDGQILRTDLANADLRFVSASARADFRNAYLHDAHLHNADLSGALLVNADLNIATLCDTVLTEADFRGAVLRGAVLSGVDLGRTNGLTWDQLDSAKCFDADKLPHYLLEEEAVALSG